jgi:hypothetical protein
MGLKIYLDRNDGKAYELLADLDDELVTRVSLNGRQGEAGAMNVDPNEAEVVLRYEATRRDGRPTLVDVESHQNRTLDGDEVQERIDTLATLPSNTNRGEDVLYDASVHRQEVREEEERIEATRVENEAERQRQLDQVQGVPVDDSSDTSVDGSEFDETSSAEGEEQVDPSDVDGGGHSDGAETGSTDTSGFEGLGGTDDDSTTTEPSDEQPAS